MLLLTFHAGRDNEEHIQLLSGNSAVDLNGVTRVLLALGETAVDSDDMEGGAIDWPVTITYRGRPTEVVQLRLGRLLPVGRYAGRLVVYDAAHANGVVWDEVRIQCV